MAAGARAKTMRFLSCMFADLASSEDGDMKKFGFGGFEFVQKLLCRGKGEVQSRGWLDITSEAAPTATIFTKPGFLALEFGAGQCLKQ